MNGEMRNDKKAQLRALLWLIRCIGLIVPQRLRADWRQEWEAELRYREQLLAEWDKLNWQTKLDLWRRSLGAFWDALLLQPKRWEDEMMQDLRYAVRMLLKSKMFTLVAVLSLALGIGANTAIFSLLDAVLLKSLPVQEPEKLVLFGKGEGSGVTGDFPNGSMDLFSYPFYQEVRQQNQVFSEVAALLSLLWSVHGSVNSASGEPEKLDVQLVSGTYFPVLGVQASLGRTFTAADDQTPGEHAVAVVSYAWWKGRLGGDPAVIGKTLTIDQTTYTIIGVAPKEFFGTKVGEAPDMWIPLAMEGQMPPFHWKARNNREFQSLYLLARLKEGVPAAQASAAVNLHFKQFLQAQAGAPPSAERLQDIQRASIELTPAGKGLSKLRREFSLSLRILMAVVGFVLLIACANVANLLLARAANRQKEFAVRLAVGAGRIRLIRQLLTESILLASLGGLAGILLAWWGSRLLVVLASSRTAALPLDVTPNVRILGFTLLASLLSAILFGTAPAWRAAKIEPNSVLKGGKGAAQAVSQSPFGKVLVVVQVALSLLLLVGAGLFMRTLINLQNVPAGFNQQNAMLFQVDTSLTGYQKAQFASLLREVEEKVQAVPGVQTASFAFLVFNQGFATSEILIPGQTLPEGEGPGIKNNYVGRDYFAAMGIPLIAGRGFGPQDSDQSPKVAVISETLAQRFFPGGSPLGKRFGKASGEEFEIIGVVKDAKYRRLTEEPLPMAYYPYAQGSGPLGNLVVRFSGPPDAALAPIRQAIKQVNRNLPVDEVVSLSEHVGQTLIQQRLIARLATFFGLLALLLACVGLYGVLAYGVSRRTSEIGLRMALGAQSNDVLRLVLREALKLVLAGIVVGIVASLVITQGAATLLFGLQPTDPLTISGATALLLSMALLAAYLPARRAARVDPMVALRDE
jgi:predicted permease